jgi:hypothetical protein
MRHLIFALVLLAASGASAQPKFFVGTTAELHRIRAVADMIRHENGGGGGPGVYCLYFLGAWCAPMDASCFAPPYTGSCGSIPVFGGMMQAPISHAWGPLTGTATAGLPGPNDFFELEEAAVSQYIGQMRMIDGQEVAIPPMMTFEELPQPAQNAIVEHVCTGAAAEHCQAGVLYCCE